MLWNLNELCDTRYMNSSSSNISVGFIYLALSRSTSARSVSVSVLTQAFAWFSDLLVEHAEIFWGFFAVDMDQVLADQPPDTWDSFPLFQILNDYLRADGKYICLQSQYSGRKAKRDIYI